MVKNASKGGIGVLACIISVILLCESTVSVASDAARKALGVIEIAAQQDYWYAQFLKSFLRLPEYSEDYNRDLILIAHMALTQATAMGKPLPLPLELQNDLLRLFDTTIATSPELNETRCIHNGVGVPYAPIANPGRRPDTCVCYDLYVLHKAIINSLAVTGTATVGGDLIVSGSLIINGSFVITGTPVFDNLTVLHNETVGNNLTVGGTTTLSSLGIGVVQSSNIGVLSSSAGADGQLLIGTGVSSSPVWANLTSTGGTVAITNGPGTIDLETTGSVAIVYVEDVGTATPVAGILNVRGGSNVNTSGSGNTVTINLNNSPVIPGTLTVTGSSTLSSLTVTGGSNLGTTTISQLGVTGNETVGGALNVTGTTTLSSLGIGVVQSSSSGVLSSSAGANGQLLIGTGVSSSPVWANLTSTGGTVTITNGPGAIDLETTGSVAIVYVEDVGTATPVAGVLNVRGGSNINTAGSGNTVTINLNNSPVIPGTLTVTGSTTLSQLGVTGNENIGGNLTIGGSLNISGTATSSSNLNVTGTGTFGALSVLSTATIGGSLIVDGLIYQPNQMIPPNNIAYVQKSPITASNQFNSIHAALSAISLLTPPSATNPYCIEVTPGVFVEPQLQMLSFVTLQGSGSLCTVIQAATPNQNVIVGAANSIVRDVTINGATGAGFSGVLHNQGGAFAVVDCYLGNNNIQMSISNNIVANAVAVERSTITPLTQFAQGFVVQGQGNVGAVIDTMLWAPAMNPLFQSFATATGPGVFLQVSNSNFGSGTISPVLTGTAIAVQNGAFLRATGTLLGGFSEAIGTIAAGAAPKLLLSSVIGQNNTWDLVVQHPGTFGSVNASFTAAKTNIDPNSPLAVFLVDPTAGEIVTEGHTQWGPNFSLATDIYYLLNQGWNTGVVSGGSLIFSSTSLVITATAGVGYVMNQVPSPLHLQIVNWPTQSITLPPLTESFLYIADDATLQSSVAPPANEFTILLGKAYTTATGVLFAQEFFPDAQHTGERLTSAIENSFGVVYISGSMVSSTTGNQLDVTMGSYVFGTQQYAPSGGSPISFSTWMLTGTGGYMLSNPASPITNVVDTLEWDPGTGTLSLIPTGSVTKHVLYIAGDGIYEHYMLQYGQQLFSSVIAAQNGPIPPQPSIWTGDIAHIATIIVGPVTVSTGTIDSIQDIRPIPSFKGAATSGVTVHGDLSGLLADDHPQYLLVNGTRAMSGDLQMNGNDIIMNNGSNYGLVDGVLVYQHGSRHLPLGQDPLVTDTPVTIGTTNSIGIANAFARSDHVHAHGNQPGGTLHAIATESVAGFMSAADKTLLDSLVSSTHIFIQQGGNTFGAPIIIGTQDNYALNLETNGTTWLTIASTGTVTLESLGIGVVQSSNTGVLSSSAGANGQLLIGTGVSSSPVWANLTSTGGTVTITNGPGTIDLETTGSVAIVYVEDVGTAIPLSGMLNVRGGSNVNTSGSGNTVTINLNNSPVIPGTLTVTGSSTLSSLTVTGGSNLGTTTISQLGVTGNETVGGALNVTGTTTLSSLGIGVVQSSNTGVLSSSAGANGQLLIGTGVSSSPAWANLTSTGGTVTITNGPGTIDLETTGSVAIVYAEDVGTAIPVSGILNVRGGSNVNTSGSGNTVTINLSNSPVIPGTLTVTGSSTLSSLTVTGGSNLGTTTISQLGVTGNETVGGALNVTGTTTLNSLGIGVVQSSNTGVLSSSAGANGQLLIGTGVSSSPVWANLTSTGGTVTITNGPGTIDLETTGSVAIVYVEDVGTATPVAGVLNVRGGSNLNTAGSGSTVTINLNNSPVIPGTLTVTGSSTLSSLTVTGGSNLGTTTISQLGVTGNETVGGNESIVGNELVGGTLTVTGSTTLSSLTVTGGSNLGTTTISQLGVTGNETVGGTLQVTGATTLSALGIGVVQASGTGLLSSSAGANGQLLIGTGVGSSPVWANLTSNNNTIKITNGAGTIDLSTTGSAATSYVTNAGTAIPASGVLNVLGGSNINTSGSTNTVTINLNNSPVIPGTLTVTGSTTLSSLTVSGGSNLGPTTISQLGVTGNETVGGNESIVGNELVGGTLTVTGSSTLSSLTVTGGSNLGTTTISQLGVTGNETVGGTLQVTGATTLSALGIGVVQASGSGLLSSSAGANGQLLIGTGVGSSPVWANLTSNNNTIKITNGAGTIDLSTTGSAATSYVTNAGTAIPASGVLNVLGGSNINTSGSGSTVTINLNNSPVIPGTLTVTGSSTLSSLTVTGGSNLGPTTISQLGVTGNETVGGTLQVTGATTLSSLTTTGNELVGGTLTVTGSSTLSSLNVTGGSNLGATTASSLGVVNNETVGGTLQVTGATTLSSLTTTGNELVGGTLTVTGSSTLSSLTVTGGSNLGTTTISQLGVTGNETVGGTLQVTGATTLSALGIGVVQASGTGLLSSSAGANGQLLIGTGVGSSPVWANLTSANNTIRITNGAGTIDLSTTGSAATSYVTNAGTAIPASGVLNVLGGSNINTSGSGNTVTINLNNSPVIPGTLTVTGSTTLSSLTVTGGSNLGTTTISQLGVIGNETVGGTMQVTGATTLSALGIGVVQASNTGLLSSSAGAAGQLLIGVATNASPVWANLTSANNTIRITNGAGTIDLATTGSAATSYVTNAGTAIPASGVLNVLGGSNINTAGSGSTVTINLNNSPVIPGTLTVTGSTTLSSLTVTGGSNLGPTTISQLGVIGNETVGGTLQVTGATTLSALGIGVVQASGTGLLSSSAGANGQLLIGTGVGSSPVWANLTSNNNTIKITNGAGTIDLSTTGSAATSYVTNAGAAIPASGVLNVLGGSNINTSGSGSTVTINLNNSPVIPGTLTVTGSTTLSSLTVTGGSNLGATTASSLGVTGNETVGGTLQVTGATTLSALGIGVVQASGTGLLSSSAGANGQLLIGTGVGSSPVWANLTSNNNTIRITNGAGTIDLSTTGSAATSYVTNAGTAIPASGVLNVLGGSNINTSGSGSTVTINLNNSPVIPGTLTVTGSTTLSSLTVTGGSNLGPTTISQLGVIGNETVGGTMQVTGATTLSALGIGVVQASNTGLLSSSAGANGQLLIGTGVGSSPVWANLTSNNNTIRITNGAGTIDLSTTGSAATSYVTNAGTAIPASGVLNVLGGSNINTAGSGSTVTINLNNSPVIPGTLTVTGSSTLSSLTVTGGSNLGATTASSLGVVNNETVGGTLQVTGATTLSSLTTTGNELVGGTLTVTGSSTLSSLTVSGGSNLGPTTISQLGVTGNETVGGTMQVTGATTLSALGIGVVQASNTGLLSSSAGAAGQLLIGVATNASPVWANLTSNNNTIKITNGAGTIDLATTGSEATSYVTNAGTAIPASGVLNVLGGSNINTSGSGSTVTINLNNSPVIPGTLTVTGSTTLSSLTVTGGSNLGVTTASSLGVVNNETVGGTLQVTGATTLSSLTTTGNELVGGTLTVTGSSTLSSLTVSGGSNLGPTTASQLGVVNNETVGGTMQVTGATTLSALGIGVVQASNTGLLSSSAGAAGQLLIGVATNASPVWANLTSANNTIRITNGAGTIDLATTGSVATSYVTNAGTAIPASGVLNVLGGSNITTSTTASSTISINLVNSPSVSGSLTAGTVVVASAGSAGAPSHTFTGSTSTGLYSPATNQVALASNGVQRLSIDNNGAVTIAAPSAGSALSVTGGTGAAALAVTAGSGQNAIQTSTGSLSLPSYSFTGNSGVGIYSPAAGQMALVTTGTTSLLVDSVGAVRLFTVYYIQVHNSASQSLASGSTVAFNTKDADPNNNFSTNQYTAPVKGIYLLNVNGSCSAGLLGATIAFNVLVNGSAVNYLIQNGTTGAIGAVLPINVSGLILLNVGDVVKITTTSSATMTITSLINLSIVLISTR